jgi:hypothetical protein
MEVSIMYYSKQFRHLVTLGFILCFTHQTLYTPIDGRELD